MKRSQTWQELRADLESERLRRQRANARDTSGWKSEGTDAPALVYSLTGKLTKKGIQFLQRMKGSTALLNPDALDLVRLRIRQAKLRRRVDIVENGAFGDNWSLLSNNVGSAVFVDHGSMTQLGFDESQIPVLPHEDVKINARIVESESGALVLLDTGDIHCEWALTFEKDPIFQPYAAQVWEMLLGPMPDDDVRESWRKQLCNMGMPSSGALRLQANDQLASFSLSDMELLADDDEPFILSAENYRPSDVQGRTSQTPFDQKHPACRRSRRVPKDLLWRHLDGKPAPQAKMTQHVTSSTQSRNLDRVVRIPSCRPSTLGAVVSMSVEQKLADDIKFLGNQVTRRLDKFEGQDGRLTIDWLDQFEAAATSSNGTISDGLFCALSGQGIEASGLLEILAANLVRRVTRDGQILQLLTLSPSEAAAIASVLADDSISPANRFDRLPSSLQTTLQKKYLEQLLGRFEFSYPNSTGWQGVFHGLLEVRVDGIEFELEINREEIFESLDVGDGHVRAVVRIPALRGRAWVTRSASRTYWIVAGLSPLACIVMPALCSLIPYLAAVGAVLTDFGGVFVDGADLEFDVQFEFQPNSQGILAPRARAVLDGELVVGYGSFIPTGLHQLINEIVTIVANHTDDIVTAIEGSVEDSLDSLLGSTLGLTFPPKLGDVDHSGIDTNVFESFRDHVYLRSVVDAAATNVTGPFITQVGAFGYQRLMEQRDVFNTSVANGERHYLSMVISQNYLNMHIHERWKKGTFTHVFSTQFANQVIAPAIRAACPGCTLKGGAQALLWPAAPPKTVLSPVTASVGRSYLMTYFDDLRLCVEFANAAGENPTALEFKFAAKVPSEVGFGRVSIDGRSLDLLGVSDVPMDVYFELGPFGASITDLEIHDVETKGPGSEPFSLAAMRSEEMQGALSQAVAWALRSRSNGVIRRDEGEPVGIQRYTLIEGPGEPFSPTAYALLQIIPESGLLYIHAALGGLATTLLEGGAFAIDSLSCADVEFFLQQLP